MSMKTIKKIISSLLVASMAFTMTATPTHAEQQDPYENLIMNKSSSYDPQTEEATIILEAYAEGKIVQSSQPTDIVLVLDVSGSMSDSTEGSYKAVPKGKEPTYSDLAWWNSWRSEPYFVKVDNKYYQVRVHDHNDGYDIYYEMWENGSTKTVCFGEKASIWKLSSTRCTNVDGKDVTYYTLASQSKMKAMKNAVQEFLAETDRQNANMQDKNRIAIVKFAGRNTDKIGNDMYRDGSNRYNYSQVVSDFSSDMNSLSTMVDELIEGGATQADFGLQHANHLLENVGSDRNKAVIFFTDGQPTSSNGFQDRVANSAIVASENIKQKGAKVYSIGVFDDANPEDDSKQFNQYMHRVSSNYTDARSYWTGTRVDSKYYLAANNSGALNDIFGKINEDIQSNSSLNEKTILRDIISDSFKVDKDVTSVTTYVADAESVQDGKLVFGDRKQVQLDVSMEGSQIDVSGFDYNGNAVVIDRNGNIKQGQKLIVEIKTKPKDGFIGGNAVTTNHPDSGIVVDGQTVKKFNQPTVDVDIKFDYSHHHGVVYAGSDFTDLGLLLNLHTYKNDRNNAAELVDYTLDGINNKYVDIIYEIYAYDEAKENPQTEELEGIQEKIAGYTIPACQTKGQFDINQFNARELKKDQKYVIKCHIRPVTTGNVQTVEKEDHLSNVYVVKPNVTLKDDKLFLGNTSQLNERVQFDPNKDWSYNETTKVTDGKIVIDQGTYAVQGNKSLTFNFKKKSGADDRDQVPETFTPNTAGESKFTVIAKNGHTDISDVTTFNNDMIHPSHVGSGHKVGNEFNIVAVSGSLTVNKKVEGKYDEEKTRPIFTFKIETLSKDGRVVNVEYRTLDLKKNDSITLNDLEAGKYRVTELKTLRFKLKDIKEDGVVGDGEVAFDHPEKTAYTIDVTNVVKSNNYFSDNGYIINKFKTENGKVNIEVDQ